MGEGIGEEERKGGEQGKIDSSIKRIKKIKCWSFVCLLFVCISGILEYLQHALVESMNYSGDIVP